MSISSHSFEQYTIAFYNLENLFDYRRDPRILDEDFTSEGKKEWTRTRYEKKLEKLAMAISRIGYDETGKCPDMIGVAEVENQAVLEDLINQPMLKEQDYGFVHFDSPDERGIDVALIYKKKLFSVDRSEAIPIYLEDHAGRRDTTRDILCVEGTLVNVPIRLYVNHWPSRRDGADETDNKRLLVADQLLSYHNRKKDRDAVHTIVLGDFNDDPNNESIKKLVNYGFLNLTAPLKKAYRGTVNHKFKWSLFDQILATKNIHNDVPNDLYLHKANIFDDIMLRQWKGKYRGQPARTFVGNRYKGGYSDHFPVYMILRRN